MDTLQKCIIDIIKNKYKTDKPLNLDTNLTQDLELNKKEIESFLMYIEELIEADVFPKDYLKVIQKNQQ